MNIPTAEEFLEDFDYKNQELGTDINYPMIERCMVEFAKLHVKAALKEASENVDINKEYYESLQEGSNGGIDMETILSAYPFENIK
jgi:hypothetical protein